MSNQDPRSLLATAPMSGLQISVCLITAILNALDGFDLLAISFATPGIMKEFHIDPSVGLGVVLSMDLWGMAVGSFLLGGVADYIGRRRAILAFLVVMAVGMYFCSHARDLDDLRLWRFLTGLGIGGMLAAINATAAEFSNDGTRKFWVGLMTIGYPLGNILAALIIAPLLKTHDWRIVFELGAAATAAMFPVVWFCVPESVSWLCRRQPANALARINATLQRMGHAAIQSLPTVGVGAGKAPLADVFRGRFLALTLLLVLAYFAHITSFYYILKWVAPIVFKMGHAPPVVADVLFWASVGGAVGGGVLGLLSLRLNLIRLTVTVLLLGMVSISIFGMGQDSLVGLKSIVAICGFFTNAGIVGLYTLLALAYPTHLRATGTGVVIGAGRGGAALAPILAGYLFQQGFTLQSVSVLMGCGSLLGAVALLFVKIQNTSEAAAPAAIPASKP
ncbi:MAG TPA: MFS transporter [Steroidobacteraceae bacterium]|nr:MFS transporter [Steroidobacteraceae bacterium]